MRCSNFRCSCSSGHYCVPLSFRQAFCGVSWCRVGRFCWFHLFMSRIHEIKYSRTFLDMYGISYMHVILYVMCCFSFCVLLFTSFHFSPLWTHQIHMFSIGSAKNLLPDVTKSCDVPTRRKNHPRKPVWLEMTIFWLSNANLLQLMWYPHVFIKDKLWKIWSNSNCSSTLSANHYSCHEVIRGIFDEPLGPTHFSSEN